MEPGSSSRLQSPSRFAELLGALIAVVTLALPLMLVSQTPIPQSPSSSVVPTTTVVNRALVP